jgi:hypothetical protein
MGQAPDLEKSEKAVGDAAPALSREQVVSLAKPDSTAVVKGTSTSDVLLLLETVP